MNLPAPGDVRSSHNISVNVPKIVHLFPINRTEGNSMLSAALHVRTVLTTVRTGNENYLY